MVLIQITMTYNDIFGIAPITSNATVVTPVNAGEFIGRENLPTLLYNVNLDRGVYKAKIVGIKVATGFPQSSLLALLLYANPALYGISSSMFRFPASADSIFWFSSNSQYSLGCYSGNKEFIIDNPTGQMDITLHAVAFGDNHGDLEQDDPPFTSSNNAHAWDNLLFAYILLTIDVEPLDLPQTDHQYSRKDGFLPK